jgi:hypothetical protein
LQFHFRNLGAFFAALRQKTGLSAAIPQPACGGLAGFPLQSLAHGRAIELFGNLSFRTTSPEKENLPPCAANSARLEREP